MPLDGRWYLPSQQQLGELDSSMCCEILGTFGDYKWFLKELITTSEMPAIFVSARGNYPSTLMERIRRAREMDF